MNIDPNQLIAQMHKMQQAANSNSAEINFNPANQLDATAKNMQVANTQGIDFERLFTSAIERVNHYQQASAQAAVQVETGDGGASLVKAVIASQKASIAFQATVQVRNKIVSAYQDIMNMPI